MTRRRAPARSRRPRGAALLTAMIIVALVTTLAASMIWQQWRAIQVETAERARTQSAWILNGALDWARLILREDARNGGADHLGEVWATPLAEARLSTFLAADRGESGDDSGPEAFLSGSISDLQSRYNLRNLVENGVVVTAERRSLERLCEAVGVSPGIASQIARSLLLATNYLTPPEAPASGASRPTATAVVSRPETAPLMPQSVLQFGWFGIDAAALKRLEPYVTLLPVRTPLNVNTAPREVIAAVIDGIDLGTAERIVQTRQRQPFNGTDDVKALLPGNVELDVNRASIASSFFEIVGRLRLERRVLEDRWYVERKGLDIVPWRRERITRDESTPSR